MSLSQKCETVEELWFNLDTLDLLLMTLFHKDDLKISANEC